MQPKAEKLRARAIITWINMLQYGAMLGIETAFVAVVSGGADFVDSYSKPTTLQQGFMTACFPVFACLGSFVGVILVSFFDKKQTLVCSTLIWLSGYLVTCFCLTFPLFLLGRMIKCLALGVISSLIPLYVKEVFDDRYAHHILASVQSMIPFGVFFTSAIATILRTRLRFNICWLIAASPVVTSTLTSVVGLKQVQADEEETRPTHTIVIERMEWDILTLSGARDKDFDGVPEQEKHHLDKNGEAVSTDNRCPSFLVEFQQLFSYGCRRKFFYAIATQILVQLTGINIIMYYMPFICLIAGLSLPTASITTLGLYACNFLATLGALGIIPKFDRTRLLRTGCFALCLTHALIFLLMMTGHQVEPINGNPSAVWALAFTPGICVLVLCFLFVFIFGLVISGVSMVYTSEVIPSSMHATGVGTAVSIGWLANFFVAVTGPPMLANLKHATFALYSVMCCFLGLLVSTFIETRETRPMAT